MTHSWISRVGDTNFTGDQRIWSFIAGWAHREKTRNGNILLSVETPRYSWSASYLSSCISTESTLTSTPWLQANAKKAVIAQLEGMPGFRFAQVLGELHRGPRCPSLNMTAVMNWAPTFIDPLEQAVSSPLHDNSQYNEGLILAAFFFLSVQ